MEEILGERLNKANRSAIAKMRSLGMTDEVITATAHYAVGHAKSDSRGYVPYFMTVLRERLKNGVLTAADLSRPKEQSRPKQEDPSGYLSRRTSAVLTGGRTIRSFRTGSGNGKIGL